MTSEEHSTDRSDGARAVELPTVWSGAARTGVGAFRFANDTRPWNWLELDSVAAAELWRILTEFVAYFNQRYGERPELCIPRCWAEHGPLVEEITTLWWARWQAFESDHASIGGAQYWHTYTVPGFFERIGRWLGTDRLERCRQGRHEVRTTPEHDDFRLDDCALDGGQLDGGELANLIARERRREQIAALDFALRDGRRGSAERPSNGGDGAPSLPIPFLERG